MRKEQDTQSTQPGARTYKVEQMVAAVRKGAAQQIERLKIMVALLDEEGKNEKPEPVKNSFTESSK